MSAERHRRLMDLFDAACDLSTDLRERMLGEACASDPDLLRDVEAMLARDARPGATIRAADGGGAARQLFADIEATAHRAERDGARPGASDAPPPRLTQIGGYRILRKIGEGGMGVVYEAQQESPRRRVALKLIRPEMASPALFRRFEHEAEVLGRLHHPMVAQIFEASSADTPWGRLPYFAMEYIDGVSLGEFVRRFEPTRRECLELLAGICDGVEHAHQKGVIHRDLKPGNILIARDSGEPPAADPSTSVTVSGGRSAYAGLRGLPKILDFGIARAVNADAQSATLQTAAGQLVGTLPYMSPEQVQGDPRRLDTRSDVYALGVIGFEMLTGRLPYDLRDKPLVEAARVVRETEPIRPSGLNRALRGDIDTILLKALEKDRGRRYQSASELAADLRRCLRDEPIAAHPPSAFYHLRKFAKRNKVLVGAAVLVFGVSTAAAVTNLLLYRKAEQQRQAAEKRFTIARDLSEILLRDIAEKLGRLPGGQELRLRMIRAAAPYYHQLADERPEDLSIRRHIWLSLQELGRLSSDVGEFNDARDSLLRAERLIDDALAVAPRRVDFLADRGSNDYWLGWMERQRGDREAAERHFRSAIQRLEPHVTNQDRSLESSAGDDSAAARLALVYRRLGDLMEQRDVIDEAEELFRKSLAIDEGRMGGGPSDPQHQLDLTRTYRRLGNLARRLGDRALARELLLRTVAVRERLVAAHPTNSDYLYNLPVAQWDWGRFLMEEGDLDAAEQALLSAIAISRRIVENDPRDGTIRRNLAVQYATLAELHDARGDDAEARCRREDAAEEYRVLTTRSEASPPDLERLEELRQQLDG